MVIAFCERHNKQDDHHYDNDALVALGQHEDLPQIFHDAAY